MATNNVDERITSTLASIYSTNLIQQQQQQNAQQAEPQRKNNSQISEFASLINNHGKFTHPAQGSRLNSDLFNDFQSQLQFTYSQTNNNQNDTGDIHNNRDNNFDDHNKIDPKNDQKSENQSDSDSSSDNKDEQNAKGSDKEKSDNQEEKKND